MNGLLNMLCIKAFNFIKLYLESHIGMAEVSREYQFQDISGDSLFLKMEGKQ